MGNSDIRNIAHIEKVDEEKIIGSTVAIDAPNWLYRYIKTTTKYTNKQAYKDNEGNLLPNLIGVPRGLSKILELNLKPIFIFDGISHDLKENELDERRKKREEAAKKASEANDEIQRSIYEARAQQIDKDIIETTKEMFDILNIDYMVAPSAAEAQASYMSKSDEIDYVISEDYDCLLFGSEKTVRKFTKSEKTIEIMNYHKTLHNLNINKKQLIVASLLCGTDYNEGVYGIGPKKSIKYVKEYDNVKEIKDEYDIQNFDEIYKLFSNYEINNDFDQPKTPNPNVDNFKTYLRDKGINLDYIDNTINKLEEKQTQKSLDNFT